MLVLLYFMLFDAILHFCQLLSMFLGSMVSSAAIIIGRHPRGLIFSKLYIVPLHLFLYMKLTTSQITFKRIINMSYNKCLYNITFPADGLSSHCSKHPLEFFSSIHQDKREVKYTNYTSADVLILTGMSKLELSCMHQITNPSTTHLHLLHQIAC